MTSHSVAVASTTNYNQQISQFLKNIVVRFDKNLAPDRTKDKYYE